MDEEYDKICEKLGFIPREYKPSTTGTEDDSKVNPFSVLSREEKMYLYKKGYLNKKQE